MRGLPRIEPLLAQIRTQGAVLPDLLFTPLLFRGRDVLDLIHRLSTNDLRAMRPGIPVRTVFTTEKGRVIDHVDVVDLNGVVCVLVHAHAAAAVVSWIDRFTISEDVALDAATSSSVVTSIVLDEADSRDTDPLFMATGAGGSFADSVRTWESRFGPIEIRHIVHPVELASRIRERLGLARSPQLSLAEYQAIRVFLGVPSSPEELNEDRNPLECGLRASVSFTKGCYVGQEVVARLDAYEKVQRELATVAIAAGDAHVDPGAEILTGAGELVGTVTSVGGILEGSNEQLLLGFVKKGITATSERINIRTVSGMSAVRFFDRSAHPLWPGGASV